MSFIIYSCISLLLNFCSLWSVWVRSVFWKLCTGWEKMVSWKTRPTPSGPWSLTVSFMEWPSQAVNDQRHSRVHDCCVRPHLEGGCRHEAPPSTMTCSRATPPGMLFPARTVPPPHLCPHTRRWGQELDGLEGQLYFQRMTNCLRSLVESTYLPAGVTCGRKCLGATESKQPATGDDCNPAPLENWRQRAFSSHSPIVSRLLERTFHPTEGEETRWQL